MTKKITKEPKKVGRPTKYTPEMAQRICDLIATTDMGYKRISEANPDLPDRVNVNIWRRKYPEFRHMYAQAKAEQIDCIIEEIIDIADDGTNDYMKHIDEKTGCESWRLNGEHIQRSRVRIDTRKWLAAKLVPKVYGDSKEQELPNKELDDDCKKRYAEMDKSKRKEF